MDPQQQQPGSLSWRLSSHPLTLIFFLAFRIAPVIVYLLGSFISSSFILIFIISILLLSADFYNIKNIAGRRLVGLRWWNEVDAETGESKWVFESSEPPPAGREINKTDSRFFWLSMYSQPVIWVALAFVAIVRLHFFYLILVVIAMTLSITNMLAFSRCDKFSQASNLASSALYSGGLAGNIASGVVSRFFGGR